MSWTPLVTHKKGVDESRIDSYQVNEAKSISHLIYADDILIFCKSSPKPLLGSSYRGILETFSNFSWLEVNSEKSSAHYSQVVEGLPHIQEIIGFPTKPLPL